MITKQELEYINCTIDTYNTTHKCPDCVILLACELNTDDRPELEEILVEMSIKASDGEELEKIEA